MNYYVKQHNNDMVRVLHVHSSLAIRNGMLSVTENYRHYIDASKIHFDYLYFNDLPDNRRDEIESDGCKTFLLPFQDSKRPLGTIDSFFSEHDGEYDILHCHPPFAPQVFGRAAKRHGVRHIIAHSHSTKFSDKRISAARNWLLSKFLGFFATDYIACSEEARVLFGKHGKEAFILRNAIDCVKYSFDPEARSLVRGELGIDDRTLLLGSVGRLAPEKNQVFMIELLNELKLRGVACKLALAGSGNCEANLRSKAECLKLNRDVLFLGNRADTPQLYSGYDVFLLSSLFEGVPLSALEAQASGLQCILSNCITREVGIGNVLYLPINDGVELWVEAIMASHSRRMDAAVSQELLKRAGYDIRCEANNLAKFYYAMTGRAWRND